MLYFGPLKESGHFMFYEGGQSVPWSETKTICPWRDEIDGGLQPGRPDPGDRLQRRTRSRVEGEAALHHKDGWTALAFWDCTVDTRPGSSSTYLTEGTLTFEEIVAMAKVRFSERWNKMQFEVKLIEVVEGAC